MAAADFNLVERTGMFVNDLDDRFGIHAQVTAAGTASAYLVSAILVLLGYGPRFVSAALRPDRRPRSARP